MLTEPFDPIEQTDVEKAFPAHALDIMPAPKFVEQQMRDPKYRDWLTMARDMVLFGIEGDAQMLPRTGVHAPTAWGHIVSIVGSYAPQVEHKVNSLAFLLERWFAWAAWHRTGQKDWSRTPDAPPPVVLTKMATGKADTITDEEWEAYLT
jgi:hypothetical protein